jgi:uncharacterized protein with HEPN domain
MHRDDQTRLRHMFDAASEAISFLEGHEFDEFSDNRILALAVVKELEEERGARPQRPLV